MPTAQRKSSRLSPSPQTLLKMHYLSDPSRDYYSHTENVIAVAMKTNSYSSLLSADDRALDLKSGNAIPDLKHLCKSNSEALNAALYCHAKRSGPLPDNFTELINENNFSLPRTGVVKCRQK